MLDDDLALAVWAAYGGARALGLTLDEEPVTAISRLRTRGYTWAQACTELGIDPAMRRELATAAAYAGIARWATARRDQAIRECVEAGGALRVIGQATSLSHEQIRRIGA
jgi:hypothetical protein